EYKKKLLATYNVERDIQVVRKTQKFCSSVRLMTGIRATVSMKNHRYRDYRHSYSFEISKIKYDVSKHIYRPVSMYS
ncbi:hypothetical protein L9F63_015757, partial [Diploptera punctata]